MAGVGSLVPMVERKTLEPPLCPLPAFSGMSRAACTLTITIMLIFQMKNLETRKEMINAVMQSNMVVRVYIPRILEAET